MKIKELHFVEIFKRLMAKPPEIDYDALVRSFAQENGIPTRTPEEVAAYRKRSLAAKKGWAARRAKR